MTRRILLAIVSAAIVVDATSLVHAQVAIYWQGGDGVLTDANYTDLTLSNLAPSPSDDVYFGGGGATGVTATLPGPGSLSFSRLFVGHNEGAVAGPPDLRGEGTVTISNGAQINLTGGAAGTDNAGLIVGSARSGVLNVDGAGSNVTSNRLIVIGLANNQRNRSGTVNVTNGGSLIALDGNIDVGTGGGGNQNGMQGHLVVSGEGSLVQALGGGADLNIGIRKATSSVTQTGGTIDIADVIEVGFSGNYNMETGSGPASQSPSFSISGGTTTHGGNFFVGRGGSTNATVNITGGELNTGNRFLMGGDAATGVVVNHSAGTLNIGNDLRVGDGGGFTGDTTYNLSGTGIINSTTGGIVGRQGTARLFQSGGEANFLDLLRIGARETASAATDGLYRISGGAFSAGAAIQTDALSIAPNGTGEFRVVGDDATINLFGNLAVNNTDNGVGTLAFELESGDLLSTITTTDAATFGSGSRLVFDASNAVPTQTSYDLLTALTITDEGIDFQGPTGWSYQIVGDPGLGQTLQAVGPLIAPEDADFDADGDVDGADMLAWQRGLGTTSGAALADGDANGDEAVDGADLMIWKDQFGAESAAVAAVPEPAAGVLLLTSIATIAAWRRRRR